MRRLLLLLLLPLAGCGTTFQNRVVCPVGAGPAYFISLYGPVGVSAEITREDSVVLCSKGAKQ